MIKDLSAVCIAVRDVDAAIESYQAMFGMQLLQRGATPSMQVEFAYLSAGNTCFGFIAPTDGNVNLAEFLEPWGDAAYLISVEVDDMDATLARLRDNGVEPFRSATMKDDLRLEWIAAKDTHGVIVQLRSAPAGDFAMPAIPAGSSGVLDRLSLHCIIVNDLDQAVADWERLFDVRPDRWSEGQELGNKNAVLPLGTKGAGLEIMTPRTGDEPWAKLLRERGETTFLVGFDVSDVDAVVARVRSTGRRVVGEHTSADGSKMAMVHPMDAHGVMVELMQEAPVR